VAIRLHVEGGIVGDVEDGVGDDLEFKHRLAFGGQADFVGREGFELGLEVFGHGNVALGGEELDKLADRLGIVDGEVLRAAEVVGSGNFDVIGGLDQIRVVLRDGDVGGIAECGSIKKGQESEENEFHGMMVETQCEMAKG